MAHRQVMQREMEDIRAELLQMGNIAQNVLERSTEVFRQLNPDEVVALVDQRREAETRQLQVERRCLILLSTQAPVVAKDLRITMASLTASQDLNRVIAHGVALAKIARRMDPQRQIPTPTTFYRMSSEAGRMLQAAIESFSRFDSKLALEVGEMATILDTESNTFFREVMEALLSHPEAVIEANLLYKAGHDLERIGDRATNIAERAIFVETARFENLNTGSGSMMR
ncbi:MAG: hypothetical protein EXR62_18275 [Chloroflexi bacterium]|nr:hypothetical protein [Chloroflexota bacterium]